MRLAGRGFVVSGWEYAVQCADGSEERHKLRVRFPDLAELGAESFDKLVGPLGCGPHRVVRRQVGAWEPIEDE